MRVGAGERAGGRDQARARAGGRAGGRDQAQARTGGAGGRARWAELRKQINAKRTAQYLNGQIKS